MSIEYLLKAVAGEQAQRAMQESVYTLYGHY